MMGEELIPCYSVYNLDREVVLVLRRMAAEKNSTIAAELERIFWLGVEHSEFSQCRTNQITTKGN